MTVICRGVMERREMGKPKYPIFAYLAGILTVIVPCVLPIVPASAVQSHQLGPVALSVGMSFSFVALGFGVATTGQVLGLGKRQLVQAGAVGMIGFGLVLLVPRLNTGFALVMAGLQRWRIPVSVPGREMVWRVKCFPVLCWARSGAPVSVPP